MPLPRPLPPSILRWQDCKLEVQKDRDPVQTRALPWSAPGGCYRSGPGPTTQQTPSALWKSMLWGHRYSLAGAKNSGEKASVAAVKGTPGTPARGEGLCLRNRATARPASPLTVDPVSLGGLKSPPLLIKFRISSKCKLRGKCSAISRPKTNFCNFVALFVTEGHRIQIFTIAGF